MVEDGAVGGLVHRGHPRAVVLAGEAGDVHLERHGAHGGLEVEERVWRDVEPLGDVVRVGLVRVRVSVGVKVRVRVRVRVRVGVGVRVRVRVRAPLTMAVERPTKRMVCMPVCEAMYRMRETMISSMGPRSSPSRWISSMITRPTLVGVGVEGKA